MVKNFILSSKVFHKRYNPKENSFCYKSCYIVLDMLNLKEIKSKIFSIDKFNIYSFYNKDHGYRNTTECLEWAVKLFEDNNLKYDDIKLITMPRVLGYLFNPVSFWLCYKQDNLIAVIVEVNNTFGQTHSYICHKNGNKITSKCWFRADKVFHVSPFYKRDGFYKFNFVIGLEKTLQNQIVINYYNDDKLQLATSISGSVEAFLGLNLFKKFISSPLLTFKITLLIHYQALKLIFKGIKHVPKPMQQDTKITLAKYVNKN